MLTIVISTECNLSTALVGVLIQRDFIKQMLCIKFHIVVFLINNAYQQIKYRGIYFNRTILSQC